MNHILTSSEQSLVNDLSSQSQAMLDLPIESHVNQWRQFYWENRERLLNNRSPILVNYEGNFIHPSCLEELYER